MGSAYEEIGSNSGWLRRIGPHPTGRGHPLPPAVASDVGIGACVAIAEVSCSTSKPLKTDYQNRLSQARSISSSDPHAADEMVIYVVGLSDRVEACRLGAGSRMKIDRSGSPERICVAAGLSSLPSSETIPRIRGQVWKSHRRRSAKTASGHRRCLDVVVPTIESNLTVCEQVYIPVERGGLVHDEANSLSAINVRT